MKTTLFYNFTKFAKKLKKDGEKEPFEYTDDRYYPNLKSALTSYLFLSTWNTETAEQVLKKLNEVETLIKNL